jgi:hypothetical protein
MAQTGAGLTTPDMPEKMKVAIEASLQDPEMAAKTMEAINPEEAPGFLGIPGAPDPSLILGLLWAIWVGWIFSTVGAFGGIMAGVGHITIFGLADYAKSFGKGNPVNNLLTDSIRVSNQWLVGLSGVILRSTTTAWDVWWRLWVSAWPSVVWAVPGWYRN